MQLLRKLKQAIIPNAYSAWKMRAIRDGLITLRANHRIIRLDFGQEKWGFQYSPYAYYNEHAIFLNQEHVPMVISPRTFEQLLDLLDLLPGYFVGSNSDLPISGGSILTHNHYQGGRHSFAMEKAPIERQLVFGGFESVSAGIVKWPMSVIRLSSADKPALLGLATKILEKWRSYSDASVQIKAETDGTPHHTITPIARKRGDLYELDLVLATIRLQKSFQMASTIHTQMCNISRKKISA